jgi:hypothetical protein
MMIYHQSPFPIKAALLWEQPSKDPLRYFPGAWLLHHAGINFSQKEDIKPMYMDGLFFFLGGVNSMGVVYPQKAAL